MIASVYFIAGTPYPPAGSVAPEPTSTTPMATSAGDEEAGFTAGAGLSDKNLRRVFIRKVYMILTTQLMVTGAIVCLFFFQ